MDHKSQDSKSGPHRGIAVHFRNHPLPAMDRLRDVHGAGPLALAWCILLAGTGLVLASIRVWIGTRSALELSVPELVGVTLILFGGLLLALSLCSLGYLPWSTVRALIVAGLATMLLSDGPWVLGATVTASWSNRSSAYRISLETAHVALCLDALMVLLIVLFGSLLLARRPQSRGVVLGSFFTGSLGFVIGYAWVAHVWASALRNGVQAWEVGPIVALIVATYAMGQRWGRRAIPFSASEMIQLREIRERYRARWLTP